MIRFIVVGLLGVALWAGLAYAFYRVMPRASVYECARNTIQNDHSATAKMKCREKTK